LQTGGGFTINTANGNTIFADGTLNTIGDNSLYNFLQGGATSLLLPSIQVVHEQCNTLGSASIDVSNAEGLPPYTFAWSTGATTAQIDNLSSGTYTVTITDANALSRIIPIQINGAIPVYDNGGNLVCGSICPDFLAPAAGIADGLYHAGEGINAKGTIPTGGNVQFKAGEVIKLDNSFKVQSDTDLSIEIEDCNNE